MPYTIRDEQQASSELFKVKCPCRKLLEIVYVGTSSALGTMIMFHKGKLAAWGCPIHDIPLDDVQHGPEQPYDAPESSQ